MGILDLLTEDEVALEDIALQGQPEDRIRERFAPVMAAPDAKDFYYLLERELNIDPASAATLSGSTGAMHRQFYSPVTGDNFGKDGNGVIGADPLLGKGVYNYMRYLGEMRFDADAVKNARQALEQRPGINEYSVLGGNNCIDFSMDMLDEMLRQKTGQGLN